MAPNREAGGIATRKPVIATFDGPVDLADYKDEHREGLQRIRFAKSRAGSYRGTLSDQAKYFRTKPNNAV